MNRMQILMSVFPLILSITVFSIAGCDVSTPNEYDSADGGNDSVDDSDDVNEDSDSYEEEEIVVLKEEELIYSPVPTDNGPVPEELNQIHFLRYYLKPPKDGSTLEVDAAIMFISGIFGGCNATNFLGREVVRLAKKELGLNIEIWVPDRRDNILADLTGTNAAEEAEDVNVAIDYYYNDAEIDGKKFEGFLKNKDVPFLSEFGMKLAMDDTYKVITTMMPKREDRKKKLFILGNSLGGFMAGSFPGWDFDGNPETEDDIGYNNCAGIIGLDTVLLPILEALEPLLGLLPNMVKEMTIKTFANSYPALIEMIRKGTLPRLLPTDMLGICPETFVLLEMLAMNTNWHPDEECTIIEDVPFSPDVDKILTLISATDDQDFFNDYFHYEYFIHKPTPTIREFRFTNEAMFGVLVDDNFMPINILGASVGFLDGGEVAEKHFLDNLPDIDVLSDYIELFVKEDTLYAPVDRDVLYTWANFDEVDNSFGYTSQPIVDEVTDIAELARSFWEGPASSLEWYTPMRMILDLMASTLDNAADYGLNYLHADGQWNGVPVFNRYMENGPFVEIAEENDFDISYPNTCKGYNHWDLNFASTSNPDRRENEVYMPMIDFIKEVIDK